MNLQNPRRAELTGVPFLNNALDFVLSRINALWAVEHYDDGTHKDINADSLTVAGDVTTDGTGTFTGNVTAQSGTAAREVEIGEVSDGGVNSLITGLKFADDADKWLVGIRPVESPGLSGYEYVWFDTNLSSIYPALRLVADSTNVIVALNAVFTSTVRGVQLGENASGKRFDSVNTLITRAQTGYLERGRSAYLGAWTAYVPTWAGSGSNPAIGDGTLSGKYSLIGTTCLVEINVLMGSTTTYGTGNWTFSLPVTAVDTAGCGSGRAFDSDAVLRYNLTSVPSTTTAWTASADAAATVLTSTSPFAWAQNDVLVLAFSYEIA
jgi:hypothetical protein